MPAGGAPTLWRLVLTTLASETLTFLDRTSINRAAKYVLNEAAEMEGDAFSDDPEVNTAHTDGDPFLSEGNRLLFGFRREGALGDPPWVCRYGGIVQIVEDRAADQPLSHFVAYDPLGYAMQRPVVNSSGDLPGSNGLAYSQTDPAQIAVDLLTNSLAFHGSLHLDFGQTGSYGGTIESLTPIDIVFAEGMMLGEALKKLADGDYLDLVVRAIYDPVDRPGIVGELSIYGTAGTTRNGAVFAWDMPSRSLVGVDRLLDGTQRANKALRYSGVGGGGGSGDLASDATSVTKYGQYWSIVALPGAVKKSLATVIAESEVILRKDGKQVLTLDPAPERSPDPFTEYFLGDSVPVWASRRMRAPIQPTLSGGVWTDVPRIHEIPIAIRDDSVETVSQLILDPLGS